MAEISLDERQIFKGEISKAPGSLEGYEASAEVLFISIFKLKMTQCILFTNDETILTNIENNDPYFEPFIEFDSFSLEKKRPGTHGSSKKEDDSEILEIIREQPRR